MHARFHFPPIHSANRSIFLPIRQQIVGITQGNQSGGALFGPPRRAVRVP